MRAAARTEPNRSCIHCSPARARWRRSATRSGSPSRGSARGMRLRPIAPVGQRVTHGVEEVVCTAIADELETLLQILGELLVVPKRGEMTFEALRTLEIEQRPSVVHDGGDLRPAADHTLVLRD